MRVKINFLINDNFKFRNSLNEAMTAFIYRCIGIADKRYSLMLHDNGFSSAGYKKYVYHVYAFLQNNRIVKDQLLKGKATLIFSSALEDTIIKFVEGLIKIGKVQLYGYSFNILCVEYEPEPKLNDSALFKALSPVYMMDINHNWLKPGNIEDKLIINLIEKYYALYKRLPRSLEMNIKFLNYSAEYLKYKQGTYKGYVGIVALQGDKELIKMAYESGLGSHNGIGLGLLETI